MNTLHEDGEIFESGKKKLWIEKISGYVWTRPPLYPPLPPRPPFTLQHQNSLVPLLHVLLTIPCLLEKLVTALGIMLVAGPQDQITSLQDYCQ